MSSNGALDILANVVSNVQDYLPTKKNFPEHRVSCHRCGNIRKRKLLCPRQSCPHIFCGRCADKMVEEHGEEVFADGCPVCQELCCCSSKSLTCNRQNHCYRKCPSTKGKHGMKAEAAENDSDYHISAPALEILAQVVSDPFHRENFYQMTNSNSPADLKKRKMIQPPPVRGNPMNVPGMSDNQANKTPRMESLEKNKLFLPSSRGEHTGFSPSTSSSSSSLPFQIAYPIAGSPGLHESLMGAAVPRETNPHSARPPPAPTSSAPTPHFYPDAASMSATYAMSSLSALSAAAGNYDQYIKNMKPPFHPENPPPVARNSPEANLPRTLPNPLPPPTPLPSIPNSSFGLSSLYDYPPRPKQTEPELTQTGVPPVPTQRMSHSLPHASPSYNPQYMATAAALSDSSFESYIPLAQKSTQPNLKPEDSYSTTH
jgi:hypothetical protein